MPVRITYYRIVHNQTDRSDTLQDWAGKGADRHFLIAFKLCTYWYYHCYT